MPKHRAGTLTRRQVLAAARRWTMPTPAELAQFHRDMHAFRTPWSQGAAAAQRQPGEEPRLASFLADLTLGEA